MQLGHPVACMLEVAGDVHEAVEVIHHTQACGFSARGHGHEATQLFGVYVVGPQEVVDVRIGVFTNEQGAQFFRELQVVWVGDFVGIGQVARGRPPAGPDARRPVRRLDLDTWECAGNLIWLRSQPGPFG